MANAMEIFRKELVSQKLSLTEVLPSHLTADRLTRTIISAIKADVRLLECDRSSLWRAIMSAAVFGMEVDGRHSVILKFGKKAQWIPMVSGLITLAHNAGFMIDSYVVRQKDSIHVVLGDGATINHDPAMDQGRGTDNPVTAAYAIAWPIGHKADRIFEYLELPDIIARRDRSSGYRASPNDSPWTNDFPAMARKSAIRALANHLPWQVQKAEELDGRHDRGENTWAEKMPDGAVNIEGEALDGGDGDGS